MSDAVCYVVLNLVTDAKLQCNICMEDFQLDEPVRTLPCKHFYHTVCISTWLQLVSALTHTAHIQLKLLIV